MLTVNDERDLLWYFGPGRAAFEKSPSGAVLERAHAMSIKHKPSPDVVAARRERSRQQRWDTEPPGAITAQPTAEIRESPRSEPELGLLRRYGSVSSRLVSMSERGQLVLEAYFGDSAARWAVATGLVGRVGRLGPILPMTAAGKRMQQLRGRGPKLTALQAVENEVAQHGLHPTEERRTLLEQAITEAQAMFDAAVSEWGKQEHGRQGSRSFRASTRPQVAAEAHAPLPTRDGRG